MPENAWKFGSKVLISIIYTSATRIISNNEFKLMSIYTQLECLVKLNKIPMSS